MSAQESYEILRSRIDAVPLAIKAVLDTDYMPLSFGNDCQLLHAAGLGSSQAPARLLARHLALKSPHRSIYWPSSAAYAGSDANPSSDGWIVFSQGFSANARMFLNAGNRPERSILMTAATVSGLESRGATKAAEALRRFEAEGGRVYRHPIEDEFTILPRVIGPAAALALALRLLSINGWCNSLSMPTSALCTLLEEAGPDPVDMETWVDAFLAGVSFHFIGASAEYAQNLAAKVLEGAFRPLPPCRDIFEYAHGGLQQNAFKPGYHWIFVDTQAASHELSERLQPLFAAGHGCQLIRSPLPEPWDILYYEGFLNKILLRAVEREGIDLINWPGKGTDGPGYHIDQPFGTQQR